MKYKKEEHSGNANTKEKMKETAGAPKSQFWEPTTIALVLIIILLLAYVGYNAMNSQGQPPPGGSSNSTGNTSLQQANVTLQLFVMSHCPYGVQQEGVVQDIIKKFNGQVNLSLHFIATDNGDGTFSSLHGSTEVSEDLRQV